MEFGCLDTSPKLVALGFKEPPGWSLGDFGDLFVVFEDILGVFGALMTLL